MDFWFGLLEIHGKMGLHDEMGNEALLLTSENRNGIPFYRIGTVYPGEVGECTSIRVYPGDVGEYPGEVGE